MLNLVALPGRRLAVTVSGLRKLATSDEELVWPGTGTPVRPSSPGPLVVKSTSEDDIAPAAKRQLCVLSGDMQPALKDRWTGTLVLDTPPAAFGLFIGARQYLHEASEGAKGAWQGDIAGNPQGETVSLYIANEEYAVEVPTPSLDTWELAGLGAIEPGATITVNIGEGSYPYSVGEGFKDRHTATVAGPVEGDQYDIDIGENTYSHIVAGGGGGPAVADEWTVSPGGDPPETGDSFTVNIGENEYVAAYQAQETEEWEATVAGVAPGDTYTLNIGEQDYVHVVQDAAPRVYEGAVTAPPDTNPPVAAITIDGVDYKFLYMGDPSGQEAAFAAGVAGACMLGSIQAVAVEVTGTPAENDVVAILVGLTSYPYTVQNGDTLADVVAGLLASIGGLDPDYDFMDVSGGGSYTIAALAKERGVSPVITVQSDNLLALDTQVFVEGVAAQTKWDVVAVGATVTATHNTPGANLDEVTSSPSLQFNMVMTAEGSDADTEEAVANSISEQASSDPLADVAVVGAVITITSKTPGTAGVIEVSAGTDGAGSFAVNNTVVAEDESNPLADLQGLIDGNDPLYGAAVVEGSLVLTAIIPGAIDPPVVSASTTSGTATFTATNTVPGQDGGGESETADDVAAALAAAAAEDPAYNVTAEGAVLTIEAKEVGDGLEVGVSVTGSGSFDIVHNQSGQPADDAAAILAGVAFVINDDDPLYDAEVVGESVVLVAKQYGEPELVTVDLSNEQEVEVSHAVIGAPELSLEDVAAALVAEAAEDPLYDVTNDGATVYVIAKEYGENEHGVSGSVTGTAAAFSLAQVTPGAARDTAEIVAASIASQAASDPDYEVTVDGADLVVEARIAGPAPEEVSGGSEGGGESSFSLTQDVAGAAADIAAISTGPIEPVPDIWTGIVGTIPAEISLAITINEAPIYQYQVQEGDTPAQVAAGLAAAGASDETYDFEAIDNTVVCTRKVAGPTTDVLSFLGHAEFTSEHTQVGANPIDNPIEFAHTIVEGDTLATVVTALLALIAADERFIALPVAEVSDRFTIEAADPNGEYTFFDACEDNQQSEGALGFVVTTDREAVDGTGAHHLLLDLLTSDGVRVQWVVPLDGPSEVAVPGLYSRVLGAQLMSAGSGGAAAGTISVTSEDGEQVYATVEEDGSQDAQAVFTVPAGQDFYLTGFAGSALSSQTPHVRLRATRSPDGTPLSGVSSVWFDIYVTEPVDQKFAVPLGPFRAGDDLWLTAQGAQDDELIASFQGVLVPAGAAYTAP